MYEAQTDKPQPRTQALCVVPRALNDVNKPKRLGTRLDHWAGQTQPRPQGLPRGGARAEEDPGKIR